jgi:hypothetical protein
MATTAKDDIPRVKDDPVVMATTLRAFILAILKGQPVLLFLLFSLWRRQYKQC